MEEASQSTTERPAGGGREGDGPFTVPSTEDYKPISGYGVIGNTRTVALVGYDGSIDWCCMPKLSSPSIFAAILDRKKGGFWAIRPASRASSTQNYLEDTNILRTEFTDGASRVVLTDFMPCSVTTGAWSTPPEIHRIVQCTSGEMEMQFLFRPVLNYGLAVPKVGRVENGLTIKNRNQEMVLSSPVQFEVKDSGVDATFRIAQGGRKAFVLSYGEAVPRRIAEYRSERQRARTEVFWMDWAAQIRYRGRWRDVVVRSALALKLLVYGPTGAIVAAPTTSLPESIGGDRNWDYRYSWIRDSASSLWAFYKLGCRSETEPYLHWLIDNNPSLDLDLRLMYDIEGDPHVREKTVDHLEGYKGSKPVRIGNQASEQVQYDAYGYMLDSLYFSSSHGRAIDEEMYFRFVKPLANFLMEHWEEPGNGIWEIRNRREHYVYTKAWCYAGLDRAVKIAQAGGHLDDIPRWKTAMKQIKEEILSRGWSSKKQAFVIHYGSSDLDAANLMLPLIGFLPAANPKMKSTIAAIDKELSDGALVYRYKANDGLKGKEGAFLLCGFWLVACLARLGQVEKASQNFQELVSYANHLGLFSEEVDPKSGDALGNFPQAFSHVGLILAATELDQALEERARPVE